MREIEAAHAFFERRPLGSVADQEQRRRRVAAHDVDHGVDEESLSLGGDQAAHAHDHRPVLEAELGLGAPAVVHVSEPTRVDAVLKQHGLPIVEAQVIAEKAPHRVGDGNRPSGESSGQPVERRANGVARIPLRAPFRDDAQPMVGADHRRAGDRAGKRAPDDAILQMGVHDRDALAPDQFYEVPQELQHEHDKEWALQHASPPQMQTVEGDPITIEPLRQRP